MVRSSLACSPQRPTAQQLRLGQLALLGQKVCQVDESFQRVGWSAPSLACFPPAPDGTAAPPRPACPACRRSARLLRQPSVSGCSAPSLACLPSSARRHSDSASTSLPCWCSSLPGLRESWRARVRSELGLLPSSARGTATPPRPACPVSHKGCQVLERSACPGGPLELGLHSSAPDGTAAPPRPACLIAQKVCRVVEKVRCEGGPLELGLPYLQPPAAQRSASTNLPCWYSRLPGCREISVSSWSAPTPSASLHVLLQHSNHAICGLFAELHRATSAGQVLQRLGSRLPPSASRMQS